MSDVCISRDDEVMPAQTRCWSQKHTSYTSTLHGRLQVNCLSPTHHTGNEFPNNLSKGITRPWFAYLWSIIAYCAFCWLVIWLLLSFIPCTIPSLIRIGRGIKNWSEVVYSLQWLSECEFKTICQNNATFFSTSCIFSLLTLLRGSSNGCFMPHPSLVKALPNWSPVFSHSKQYMEALLILGNFLHTFP